MTAFKVIEYRSNKEEDVQFITNQKEEFGTNGVNDGVNQIDMVFEAIKASPGMNLKDLSVKNLFVVTSCILHR